MARSTVRRSTLGGIVVALVMFVPFAAFAAGLPPKTPSHIWGGYTPVGTPLNRTYGATLDGAGNLFVADTGNNRVLRYPVVNGVPSYTADMVWGQPDFDPRAPAQPTTRSHTPMVLHSTAWATFLSRTPKTVVFCDSQL